MRERINLHEARFEQMARRSGYHVTKRGWPDFFCWKDMNGTMEIVVVEVKPESKIRPGHYQRPSPPQWLLLGALHRAGFDVRISDGSDMGARITHAKIDGRSKSFDSMRRPRRQDTQRDIMNDDTMPRDSKVRRRQKSVIAFEDGCRVVL